ncbi:MAG: hypothetical protein IKA79_05760, partial [Lentisphaeria bacterium]|nr:hypothetical protein [Lentisphaeria bacterium]
AGNAVSVPLLKATETSGGFQILADASLLECWTLDEPVLYTMEIAGKKERFGFSKLDTFRNECVLLNGTPIYLRGYIRGIIAHDHPNMTGGTLKDAAYKNIRQAKKYGFNLVRFHSTIPTEEFVEAADELGLLIHMEIGFAYEYEDGKKKNLSMSNTAWRETILKYRNHPSVCIFCIGNEMHNAGRFPQVRAMYGEGKMLAPGKLIMDNSGWGEFDRESADVYSQHIAYFFPYGRHKNMFLEDNCWRLNGNVSNTPMEGSVELDKGSVSFRQEAVPLKPTLSHEAVHYIEVADYDALTKKFDDFAAKVGTEYLEKNDIKKPRFMTELPALIRKKGLVEKMPDYIEASNQFKMMAIKCFLERLRLSSLCGYEMLQFADCFKYENKNGIVDCFDDDKYIPAEWMRQFNSDLVLLADFERRTCYSNENISFTVYASSFIREKSLRGRLIVKLVDGDILCDLPDVALAGGLQKLVKVDYRNREEVKSSTVREVEVKFITSKGEFCNSWKLWFYPEKTLKNSFETSFVSPVLQKFFASAADKPARTDLFITDKLDETVFEKLANGENTLLIYKKDSPGNTMELPSALERFKPCIWDRGSNLGGVLLDEGLRAAVGPGKYYDFNMQELLEAGSKICCDDLKGKFRQLEYGVDKPVRDRMSGILHNIKDFIEEDTLRDFSHLLSVKCKKGNKEALFCICTYNMENISSPAVMNLFDFLLSGNHVFDTDISWDVDEMKDVIRKMNEKGFRREDVMNRFWEQDNKAVEDTLFWEEAGIDLSKLGRR